MPEAHQSSIPNVPPLPMDLLRAIMIAHNVVAFVVMQAPTDGSNNALAVAAACEPMIYAHAAWSLEGIAKEWRGAAVSLGLSTEVGGRTVASNFPPNEHTAS